MKRACDVSVVADGHQSKGGSEAGHVEGSHDTRPATNANPQSTQSARSNAIKAQLRKPSGDNAAQDLTRRDLKLCPRCSDEALAERTRLAS
jgi:hypothetical protein